MLILPKKIFNIKKLLLKMDEEKYGLAINQLMDIKKFEKWSENDDMT